MGWHGFTTGTGHWQQQSWKVPLDINPLGGHHSPDRARRPQGGVTSDQVTNREGAQSHLSVDNQIKTLLSKALPTRARLSFSHLHSIPSGSLHKPLSLLHQRADRRSNENHNPTVARTKTTLQKASQEEKAENYVPYEGTR